MHNLPSTLFIMRKSTVYLQSDDISSSSRCRHPGVSFRKFNQGSKKAADIVSGDEQSIEDVSKYDGGN